MEREIKLQVIVKSIIHRPNKLPLLIIWEPITISAKEVVSIVQSISKIKQSTTSADISMRVAPR